MAPKGFSSKVWKLNIYFRTKEINFFFLEKGLFPLTSKYFGNNYTVEHLALLQGKKKKRNVKKLFCFCLFVCFLYKIENSTLLISILHVQYHTYCGKIESVFRKQNKNLK